MRRLSGVSGSSRRPAKAGGASLPPVPRPGDPGARPGDPGARIVELARGEGIQPPAGQVREVYSLRYGLVGLRRKMPGGRAVLVRLLYPGEVFCVSGIGGDGSVAQAITRSGAALIHGRGETIDESLVDILQREVDLTEQRIVELTSLTSREILARRLLEFSWLQWRSGDVRPGPFRIPVTRRELAGLMGIRPESLARLLSWMVARELIAVAGRQARILDRPGLLRIAGISDDDDKASCQKLTGVMESMMTEM